MKYLKSLQVIKLKSEVTGHEVRVVDESWLMQVFAKILVWRVTWQLTWRLQTGFNNRPILNTTLSCFYQLDFRVKLIYMYPNTCKILNAFWCYSKPSSTVSDFRSRYFSLVQYQSIYTLAKKLVYNNQFGNLLQILVT